jgi:predicted nucleotidyltransferase
MNNHKLLKELKILLDENINNKILKIIMFGSRINGKSELGSDYYILIILENNYDWKIENEIYDFANEIMLKYDVIIDVKIIFSNELNSLRGKQPYIKNALKSEIFA